MNNSVTGKNLNDWHSCNCRGPQNGEPLCPCQMKGVEVKDGRYVKTTDLGPVKKAFGDTFSVQAVLAQAFFK